MFHILCVTDTCVSRYICNIKESGTEHSNIKIVPNCITFRNMEELVTIKQEPQWIFNNDEYASSELYKDDPNISYTEYEIRPYYENDIDFEDIKCKVGYKYYWFIFIFLYFHHYYWSVYRVWGDLAVFQRVKDFKMFLTLVMCTLTFPYSTISTNFFFFLITKYIQTKSKANLLGKIRYCHTSNLYYVYMYKKKIPKKKMNIALHIYWGVYLPHKPKSHLTSVHHSYHIAKLRTYFWKTRKKIYTNVILMVYTRVESVCYGTGFNFTHIAPATPPHRSHYFISSKRGHHIFLLHARLTNHIVNHIHIQHHTNSRRKIL